jgi:hypothetical protein
MRKGRFHKEVPFYILVQYQRIKPLFVSFHAFRESPAWEAPNQTACEPNVGMVVQQFDLELEAERVAQVIGVHSGQKLAGGRADGGVQCADDAGVGCADELQAAVGGAQALDFVGGIIGGTVVADDELPVAVRLPQD